MRPVSLLRVYVETTIWNFAFADDAPEHRDATRQFFDQVRRGDFEVYISNAVLTELHAAQEPRLSQLTGLITEIAPSVLSVTAESLALAQEYIDSGMVPEKYSTDALHIAVAVVEDMDVLLSWNFKHIVKVKTRRLVSATSRLAGYRDIDICTPEEVLDETG